MSQVSFWLRYSSIWLSRFPHLAAPCLSDQCFGHSVYLAHPEKQTGKQDCFRWTEQGFTQGQKKHVGRFVRKDMQFRRGGVHFGRAISSGKKKDAPSVRLGYRLGRNNLRETPSEEPIQELPIRNKKSKFNLQLLTRINPVSR